MHESKFSLAHGFSVKSHFLRFLGYSRGCGAELRRAGSLRGTAPVGGMCWACAGQIWAWDVDFVVHWRGEMLRGPKMATKKIPLFFTKILHMCLFGTKSRLEPIFGTFFHTRTQVSDFISASQSGVGAAASEWGAIQPLPRLILDARGCGFHGSAQIAVQTK